ncbi:MAG: DUF4253 domain-containing protein [Hyphomonadaceae bacterium]|nr:DUF4253 domain-containing protein [Hyphomonadaceae bacterium]
MVFNLFRRLFGGSSMPSGTSEPVIDTIDELAPSLEVDTPLSEYAAFEEAPITEAVRDLFPFPTAVLHGSKVMENVFNGPELDNGSLPVILGEEWSVDRLADNYRDFPDRPSPGEVLEYARGINSENFLENWRRINAQYLVDPQSRGTIPQGWGTTVAGMVIDDPVQKDSAIREDIIYEDGLPRGQWPDTGDNPVEDVFSTGAYLDLHGAPFKEVLVGYLPLSLMECWQAAAHIFYSQYHSPVEVHVGLAREWYEKYGARPVVFKHQWVEYMIESPVMNKNEAIELAKVHYAYCWWSNKHAVMTIEEIASHIVGRKNWSFYWT